MKIQNLTTGEVINVSNTIVRDGRIEGRYQFGTRYFNKYGKMLTKVGDTEDGQRPILQLADGWQVVTERGEAQPEPQPEVVEQPTAEPTAEPEPEPQPQPEAQPAQPVQPAAPSLDAAAQAFAALTPLFSGVQANVQAAVMAELQPVIEKLQRQAATQMTRIQVVTEHGELPEVEGIFCDEFEDIVQDVNDGFAPYLWGAAGCGKTFTAEQVAKVLGLKFYCQTTIQFAHDVRGYGDAAGNYVPTSFYKAFSEGGLYFQDEYDRSNAEAAVVLNTALANGYYDFPVVGRVQAHPNFRFMAAGNTRMTGADEEYVSGQVQDASSRDRVIYYEMHYDRRIELPVMAQGDAELCDFVEDVRQAIKETRISHVVSYRETKYMAARKNNKVKALVRSTFKGLEQDAIRIIYGALKNTDNSWAKAMQTLI